MAATAASVDGTALPAQWRRGVQTAVVRIDTREGFRAFYDSALPQVYAYLIRRCDGDRALAEDLTQEAFLAAARQVREGRAHVLSVGWLIIVAQNRFVDHLRRRQRDERNLAVAWQCGDHDELRQWRMQRDRESAREALDELPPAQRAALELFYFEDLTVAQAAERLGRSVRATESLLARGRDALRRQLNGRGRDA